MLRTFAPAFLLFALPASASATTFHGTTVGTYSKPGAAVDFAHTVKPDGSGVNVTLDVLEVVESGTVEVELHVPDALRVSGPTSVRFDAGAGDRHTLSFSAESGVDGLHHIGVTARVGDAFRAYAVPVQIGFGGLVRKSGNVVVVRDGMAIMSATETVDGVALRNPSDESDLSD